MGRQARHPRQDATRRAEDTASRAKAPRAPREHARALGRADAPRTSHARAALRVASRQWGHAGADRAKPRTRRTARAAGPRHRERAQGGAGEPGEAVAGRGGPARAAVPRRASEPGLPRWDGAGRGERIRAGEHAGTGPRARARSAMAGGGRGLRRGRAGRRGRGLHRIKRHRARQGRGRARAGRGRGGVSATAALKPRHGRPHRDGAGSPGPGCAMVGGARRAMDATSRGQGRRREG
jgi:hypothetical protein